MRQIRWAEVFAGLGCVAIIGAIMFPVYAGSGPRSVRSPCLTNVKLSGLALIMYAGDANDRFPLRDAWMDVTRPYVKDESIRHCPSVPKGAYGYAFDAALSGLNGLKLGEPSMRPLLYDSVNPIRNASDLCASLPLPGRHDRKDEGGSGRDTVGYADGHARAVPARPVVN